MALERALKTRDIVLFNVAAIVGMRWIALAAANGPSSMFLWVLAAICFFIPQGFAVIALSLGKPDAAVFSTFPGQIPCPDCGAPGGTLCFSRSAERGPHPARVRAAKRFKPVR